MLGFSASADWAIKPSFLTRRRSAPDLALAMDLLPWMNAQQAHFEAATIVGIVVFFGWDGDERRYADLVAYRIR